LHVTIDSPALQPEFSSVIRRNLTTPRLRSSGYYQ
jgi:hypothetical protein